MNFLDASSGCCEGLEIRKYAHCTPYSHITSGCCSCTRRNDDDIHAAMASMASEPKSENTASNSRLKSSVFLTDCNSSSCNSHNCFILGEQGGIDSSSTPLREPLKNSHISKDEYMESKKMRNIIATIFTHRHQDHIGIYPKLEKCILHQSGPL